MFSEGSPTDEVALPGIEFGYLSPLLTRRVFEVRLKDTFHHWLQAFTLEAESESEKELARRLLDTNHINEVENLLFHQSCVFQGCRVDSLKDTVVGEAYQLLFRRERADMQLPFKLQDEFLDALVDEFFRTPTQSNHSRGFTLENLLKKMIDRSYLARDGHSAEFDTFLLYLSGFCDSRLGREQLRARLERVYFLLLGSGIVRSNLDHQLASLKSAKKNLEDAYGEVKRASLLCESSRLDCELLQTQVSEEQAKYDDKLQKAQHEFDTLVSDFEEDFEPFGKNLSPTIPLALQSATTQLEETRKNLHDNELLLTGAKQKAKRVEDNFLSSLRAILAKVLREAEESLQWMYQNTFPALRSLQAQLEQQEHNLLVIAEEVASEVVQNELEKIRFKESQFSLKPLDLLFFLRLDELDGCGSTKFQRLSMAYHSVIYDFIRVRFFASPQTTLNRLAAAQFEEDDCLSRSIELKHIIKAIKRLSPSLGPLLESSSLSLRRARHDAVNYQLSNELFAVFDCILFITQGFFDKEEGKFICVGGGYAQLNILLHNLICLMCEQAASRFVERLRKNIGSLEDLLMATYRSLELPVKHLANPKKENELLTSLQFLMGSHGAFVVEKLVRRRDLKDGDQIESHAAYELHPAKRWHVTANTFGDVGQQSVLGFNTFLGFLFLFLCKRMPLFLLSMANKGLSGLKTFLTKSLRSVLRKISERWVTFFDSALGSWVKFLIWLAIFFLLFKSAAEERWFFHDWQLDKARSYSDFVWLSLKGLKEDFCFLFPR